MIQLVLSFLCLFHWEAISASVSPLVSNFGEDAFRSGEVNVALGSQSLYDFSVPFASPLSTSSTKLALSMVDYHQSFDASYKVFFFLLEDTPSLSNASHATFRVQLDLYSLTYLAKVKYLACSTSILSQNFNIVVSVFSPGTLSGGGFYSYYPTTTLNTTASTFTFAIWFSGVEVWKSSPGNQFWFYAWLYSGPNLITVANFGSTATYFGSVRVTLIFINYAATTISGTYRLLYYKQFYSSYSFPYSLSSFSSWWDTNHIICGINNMHFSSNFYQYAYSFSGNTVSFHSTITGSNSWTSISECLIAAGKMCPTTHPYYDSSTNLCHDSCAGQNASNGLCTPAYVCPSNCKYCSSNTVCTTCSYGYYLRSDRLCYSSCQAGLVPGTNICCPTGCATCSAVNICLTCLPSFSLMADRLCCSQGFSLTSTNQCACLLGQEVIGGCSQVEGCKEVAYIYPQTRGTCIDCNQGLFLSNDSCFCSQSGYVIVDGSCYRSVVGCISYQVFSGQALCLFCSLMDNFQLDSSGLSCTCKQGYTPLGSSCSEVCGDGIVIESECDDGNTEDGDGCSSKCQIQPDYRCDVSSVPSSCTYIKKGIQASLVKVQRIGHTNEVTFTFTLSPNPLTYFTFAKANHTFSITLEDSTVMDLVWSYSDGKLFATGPFSFSIQGMNAMANFTFNQKYIENQPIFLNFTIKSNTTKLDFIEDTSKIVTFNSFMLGLSCASFLLLLVGSFLHKMVGVEFLHCLQLIYYLHFAFKDYTITISSFQSLSLTAVNNLYWQTENQNLQMKEEYQKVNFSIESTELTIVFLAVPVLLAILGFIIYRLVKRFCVESHGEGQHLIANIRKRLYHAFVFPFTLGFLAPFLLAHFTLIMTSQPFSFSPHSVISFLSLVIAAGTSVVLGIQYLHVPFKSLKDGFKLARKTYIPLYCFYWITMTLLLWGWVSLGFSSCLIPMEILAVSMLLFLIFCRPYQGKVDTIGSISNILLQLSFLLMVTLRNYGVIPLSQEIDVILCFVISLFCCFCFTLSVVRLILAFCSLRPKEEAPAEEVKVNMNNEKIKQKRSPKGNSKRMIPSSISPANQSVMQSLIDKNARVKKREFKQEKEMDEQLLKMIQQKKKAFRRKPKLLEEQA